ncbi:MoaD/ThiS family protein [Bacteroidota bacterium]
MKHIKNLKTGNMSITVNYMGIIAGKAKIYSESIENTGSKSSILKSIMKTYPELAGLSFSVSINGVIVHGDMEIKDGDQITLIPPAPGG